MLDVPAISLQLILQNNIRSFIPKLVTVHHSVAVCYILVT